MENKISNEEKAKSMWYHFCTEKHCAEITQNCQKCPKAQVHPQLLEIAEWKDKEFQDFIDSMGLIIKENYQNYKNTRNHNTSTKNENISIMTREEEIKQAAKHYGETSAINLACDFGWSELDIQQQCFKAGVEWADQHPRNGLVDVKK